ncbi:MAG: sugar porter family MFS transporter [Lentisphaerae bacterium]|nr:sugar porter family MFS transporter [Lentisphaerota bacterium]MCP4100266.1 sugar porter family MFS transporter [Lentisphaerota bacterium]
MNSNTHYPNFTGLILFGFASLAGLIYGFELGIIGFGVQQIDNIYAFSSFNLSIIAGMELWGATVSIIFAGIVADKIGRIKTLVVSSIVFMFGSTLLVNSDTYNMFLMSRLVQGIGLGGIIMITPLYLSEVSMPKVRGRNITCFQLFVTIGILVSYIIGGMSEDLAIYYYVPILIALAFILLGRFVPRDNISVERKEELSEPINWRFCIKPLFIALSIALLNQMVGLIPIIQYAPIILKSDHMSSNLSIYIGLANFVFTALAMFFIDHAGRKPLLAIGTAGSCLSMVFLMIISVMKLDNQIMTTLGAGTFLASFALGPGVVVWLAISEILPTPIRSKGMSVCLFLNMFVACLYSSVFLEIKQLIGYGNVFMIFAVAGLLYFIISVFFLPETKGKTLEEIQEGFQTSRKSLLSSLLIRLKP